MGEIIVTGMITGIYKDPRKGKYAAVYTNNKWYSFLLCPDIFKKGPDTNEPGDSNLLEKGNWVVLSDIKLHGKNKRLRAYHVWPMAT